MSEQTLAADQSPASRDAQAAVVACLAGRAAAYLYRKWAGDAWAALQVCGMLTPSELS